jgi:predicted nucleic acid-binding protein
MKVFLDSNVWLAAVVFPGLCAELLLELDTRGHRLLTTELVRQEVLEVVHRKFKRHEVALERFDSLWACAECVPDVAEPAQDADARLVAAALGAGAQLFITGDQPVLGWHPQGLMGIVSPRQAWERVVLP